MSTTSIEIGTTVRVGGASYTYRLTGQQTEGKMALLEVNVDPGAFFAIPHIHEAEDECVHILDGVCRVWAGEDVFDATAGATLYVPQGMPHAIANAGEAPARLLFILTPAGLEPFFAEVAARLPDSPTFPLAAFDDFNGFIQQALEEQPETQHVLDVVMELYAKYNMSPPQPEG